MKRFGILISLIALVCAPLFAKEHDGPIIVGNGGGTSEYSVVFASANLVDLLKDCRDWSCGLDPSEMILLGQLIQAAQLKPQLNFENSTVMGQDLFRLEENGEIVWINQDLLWLDAAHSVPMGSADAIVLWVKILAKKMGLSGASMAGIQAKILKAFRQSISVGKFEVDKTQTFEFLHWKKTDSSDLLVMRDPALGTINVGAQVAAIVGCVDEPLRMQMFSPAWMTMGLNPDPTVEMIMALQFGLKWQCGSRGGNTAARLIVTARVNLQKVLNFDLNTVLVQGK